MKLCILYSVLMTVVVKLDLDKQQNMTQGNVKYVDKRQQFMQDSDPKHATQLHTGFHQSGKSGRLTLSQLNMHLPCMEAKLEAEPSQNKEQRRSLRANSLVISVSHRLLLLRLKSLLTHTVVILQCYVQV